MKKLTTFLLVILFTMLVIGCSQKKTVNSPDKLAANQQKVASQSQDLFEIADQQTMEKGQVSSFINYIPRAAMILQSENPSKIDIQWIESLTTNQIEEVFNRMKDNIKIDSSRVKILHGVITTDSTKSSCWGNWQYE